jgi:hypothetical protein
MNDDKFFKWLKILTAVVFGVAFILWLVFDDSRFKADFIPLDNSRVGPNLFASVVQTGIVLLIALIVWPPFRRSLHKFFDRKFDAVHGKFDQLFARHDEHRQHEEWVAKQIATMHLKATGELPEPHPNFPGIGTRKK